MTTDRVVKGFMVVTATVGFLAFIYTVTVILLPVQGRYRFLDKTGFFSLIGQFNSKCVGPGPDARDEVKEIDGILLQFRQEILESRKADEGNEKTIERIVALASRIDNTNEELSIRAIRNPDNKEIVELYIVGHYFISAYIFEPPNYVGVPIKRPPYSPFEQSYVR